MLFMVWLFYPRTRRSPQAFPSTSLVRHGPYGRLAIALVFTATDFGVTTGAAMPNTSVTKLAAPVA